MYIIIELRLSMTAFKSDISAIMNAQQLAVVEATMLQRGMSLYLPPPHPSQTPGQALHYEYLRETAATVRELLFRVLYEEDAGAEQRLTWELEMEGLYGVFCSARHNYELSIMEN